MQIDIDSLKLVLCIINVLNLCLLIVQYITKKNKGVLYWIAGFGFIAISQFITLNLSTSVFEITYLISDLSILIGFCVVAIGISIFLNEKHNYKTDYFLTALFVVIVTVLYFLDYNVSEKLFIAAIKSIICFKITFNLFFDKDLATKKSTNFIALLFMVYGTVFLEQSISIIKKGVVTNLNSPIFIVIYLFSIVIGIISTFGFTYLINQRLTAERDKAEVSLKLTQYAVDNTSDAVLFVRKDASFMYINKASVHLLGYSYQELMNLKITDIEPNYTNENWLENWNNLKFKKSLISTGALIRKSGEFINTEVSANFLMFNGEEINCVFIRDITERKKVEVQMNELIVETLDKNSRLQNFAHIVSHNIRSHAANFSGLLQTFNMAEDQEEKDLYLNYLNSSSVKLTETIDNLNEIISIQSNTNIPLEEVNIYKEIDRTIQSQILGILKSNGTIINEVDPNITAKVIPAYLDSILLNLLTNSLKYKAKDRDLVIKISSQLSNNYTIICFEDNGIGIDLIKNGNKLFGMYKTFNGNKDAKGIGLFITKNQILAMKGKIDVESELGVGTVFKVSFKNS